MVATRSSPACRVERGAALVEFAILAPLLLLFLFGTIEFAWAFVQSLDVRHGAREGARLAAVDYNDDVNAIVQATCDRMDKGAGVVVSIILDDVDGDGKYLAGDAVQVTVNKSPIDQLTHFFGPVLDGLDLKSTVVLRLEQDASYSSTSSPIACT